MADDGLDDKPGQRRGEPENGDLVGVGAEVLVDGAHVGHLQCPAELDAQEAEAHVPDLPEAQVRSLDASGASIHERPSSSVLGPRHDYPSRLLDEQNLSFVGTDCEMQPPIY